MDLRGPSQRRPEDRWQDAARFQAFFHTMLEHGVYLPPSMFEAWFVSASHDDLALDRVINALPGIHASSTAKSLTQVMSEPSAVMRWTPNDSEPHELNAR